MINHIIEFDLWENDQPFDIQLEPECLIFKVTPNNELRFVAICDDNDFTWAVRGNPKDGGIQLFPVGKGNYEINIYENGILLEDWFKYMR